MITMSPLATESWRRLGYAVVPLLSAEEAAELLSFYCRQGQAPVGGFHASMYAPNRPLREAIYARFTAQLGPRLEPLLSGYRICTTNFMVKEPGLADSAMRMHQDWSFVDETRFLAVHVWIPLVDVDAVNGAMVVIPGSQHLGDPIRPHADACPLEEVLERLTSAYGVALPMRAGEALLYDGRLVHGSPPNQSDRVRVAASCICVPCEAPLQHWIRVSPEEIEGFAVSDAFFHDYQLFERPREVPSLGRRGYVVRQRTWEEVIAAGCLVPPSETALPAAS